MESDSDVEVLELVHLQVQDVISVNPSNITRQEPQGSPDNEEIEETQENENGENVEEANIELGGNEERDIGNEEEEEELEDEEESEDEQENIELDVTEEEDPEWKSVKSIKELTDKYGSLSSLEPELRRHSSIVRSWLADYYLKNNRHTKFQFNHWLNRYRLERLIQKINRKREEHKRKISFN